MERTVPLIADNTLVRIGSAVIDNEKVMTVKLDEPYRTRFERYKDYFDYTIRTDRYTHVMMAPKPSFNGGAYYDLV